MRGKKKYIETPEKMWQLFEDYKTHIKNNPIKKMVFVGKDGHIEYEEREKPLTMEGFEMYCFEEGIIVDAGDYFSNKDGRYSDYAAICRAIKKLIKDDQITGGMTGIYNPSITQRLNGLSDKVDNRLVDEDGKDREFSITLNLK